MKRRISSILCSLLVLCSMILCVSVNASAEGIDDTGVMVDGSLLMQGDSSTGKSSNSMLRGKHLMEGESSISKAGIGRIYAYGQTTADHSVDYVAVIMYVDRYNEETDAWRQVAVYDKEATDTYYVNIDATLKVDRGYYYRVHCDHIAGNEDDRPFDSAISYTDGIWIP